MARCKKVAPFIAGRTDPDRTAASIAHEFPRDATRHRSLWRKHPARGPCAAPSRRDFFPARSRIEGRHRLGLLRALRAEVTLVDLAIVAHHEGLDARIAVMGGPRDHGEAAEET